MASIRKVKRVRSRTGWAWEVRYRDPSRKDRSKTFDNKAKAEAFAAAVEADIDRGEYLDPRMGKKTFGEWSQEWLGAREGEIKPTTFISYQGLLTRHILPAFGEMALAKIRPLDIQRFLRQMRDKGPVSLKAPAGPAALIHDSECSRG